MYRRLTRKFLIPVNAAILGVIAVVAAGSAFLVIVVADQLGHSQPIVNSGEFDHCLNSAVCWITRGRLAFVPGLLAVATYLGTFWTFRCPYCSGRLLLPNRKKIHENFRTLHPLGPVATVVFDSYIYRKTACVHCGQRSVIKTDQPSSSS